MEYLWSVLAVLAAYLLGSLSFAVIVSRVLGLSDPRQYGSKNAGATNVLRSGSKPAAIATLVLDFLKGLLPVLVVAQLGEQLGLGDFTLAAVAVAVVVGHVFPVFFGFKGGKGVATAAGALFGVHVFLGAAVLAVFAVVLAASRIVSLASVSAALAAPIVYMLGERELWYSNRPVVMALVILAMVIAIKHAPNLSRLLNGTEPKLGANKDEPAPGAAKAKRR